MNDDGLNRPVASAEVKSYRRVRHDPRVDAVAARHAGGRAAALPILRGVQDEQGYLDEQSLGATADALGLPDAQLYGVASFYSMLSLRPRPPRVVRLCDGPVCMLNRGGEIRRAVEAAAAEQGEWTVERTSCLGLCDRAPAALVGYEACGPLSAERAARLQSGWRGDDPAYAQPLVGEVRVAMRRVGRTNPRSIESAIEHGAYRSLGRALQQTPHDLLTAVEQSGLQGRGGAGFPTGRKWRMVAEERQEPKYVILNADESEPGACKDRVLMLSDPHLVLEGMALAAYAVGAAEGVIYVRGEYEDAARLLEHAIDDAQRCGWLGEHVQGSDFSFRVDVHRGAGAYICGEETALLESLEGRRGEPRVRPPYPVRSGYHGLPTVVNNVETLCNVPAIVAHGPDWFRGMGTPGSPGTKMFTITGHVRRPTVFEAAMGVTLRQAIDGIGLGMRSGSQLKMVLSGGAAGTVVPPSLLDVPLEFASRTRGVEIGSGVIVVCDESVSVVTLLDWLLRFFAFESCGKCTPCREGTHRARCVVQRIATGDGRPGDLSELRSLARMLETTSLCGLGTSVASPMRSAIEHFSEDFARCGAT